MPDCARWRGIPFDCIGADLNEPITRALRDPGLTERFDKEGAIIVAGSPADLAAHVKAELALWAKVVKSAGLRID